MKQMTKKQIQAKIKSLKWGDIVEVIWLDSGAVYLERQENEVLFYGVTLGYFEKYITENKKNTLAIVSGYKQQINNATVRDTNDSTIHLILEDCILYLRKLK